MFGTYTAVFVAWAATFIYKWANGFLVLYVGIIAICCGSFVVAEIYYLARKAKWAGFQWLLIGGVLGLIGLYACTHPAVVCALSGKWANASFWVRLLFHLSANCAR